MHTLKLSLADQRPRECFCIILVYFIVRCTLYASTRCLSIYV